MSFKEKIGIKKLNKIKRKEREKIVCNVVYNLYFIGFYKIVYNCCV